MQRGGWYDRAFAWVMAHDEAYQAAIAPVKQQLFKHMPANAQVLEVGIGTGPNLAFYASKVPAPATYRSLCMLATLLDCCQRQSCLQTGLCNSLRVSASVCGQS